jgi:NAD-dependent SIR2 family protein deacetylase
LGGAGLSAASGIPTYRDASGNWRHSSPIQHREFLEDHDRRRRYWARSYYGWPAVAAAEPTAAHRALATLEQQGVVDLVISQNVDRLHQRAGSRAVVDLHGRLDRVQCLDCGQILDRNRVQDQLQADNPTLPPRDTALRPDGDADIDASVMAIFTIPRCSCDGILMPSVVFFGGSVPRERVQRCEHAVEQADGLLVAGSSAQVFSGFRFCRLAARLGKPVVVLNPGQTRADPLADAHHRGDCQALLPHWASLMAQQTEN